MPPIGKTKIPTTRKMNLAVKGKSDVCQIVITFIAHPKPKVIKTQK